jgi:ATP-dependent DNA helicase RecG
MTDEQFLTKLKLVVDGKLTNAAMVLLGNPDYDNLPDTPVRIMWRLYGSNDIVKDYMEFGVPFITVVDKVYAKVRNLTYRYIPNRRSLQTIDIPQYDVSLQRELLFNSIAHMEYTQGGRIYVDEYEDYIIVQNPGSFLPGDVLTVLQPWYTAPYYRNQLLAESMASFNMIDTVAMGIRKAFRIQQERLFPLPDYFFMKPEKVVVRVYGKTPNVFVSAAVAEIINEKAQCIKSRGQSDQYCKQMIIDYLEQWGKGTKQDFLTLLGDKLPDVLDDRQKLNKVKYFLTSMRKDGIIKQADGNQRTSQWVLVE